MKRLIIIPFLLFNLIVSATNYYVKNGGNNAASGLDDANAWETIAKVNSVSFAPDDCIYFKKGDTFIGTLTPATSGTSGHYITFDAYGSGADPIITPNDEIDGITWTVHSGSIYKTTDITFNPGNMLIDGIRKIPKINDYWITHTPGDGRYGNNNAMALLALSENQTYSFNGQNVKFWDGLDALYCYNSSNNTTYLRFRGGEDPNDSTFVIAADNSNCVYLTKSYIKIRNLDLVGGEYGINLNTINANHNIIEYNTIESSNVKIHNYNSARTNIYRYNNITNNYLSSYLPGAWVHGTDYIHGVHQHYYIFGKYRIGTGDSSNIDSAIQHFGVTSDGTIINNNTITNCQNGIYLNGNNNEAYENNITGNSSIGFYLDRNSNGTEVHDNYLVDCNIPFRFGYVDDTNYPGRINYIYKNRVYCPGAGEFIYIHYGNSAGISLTTAYFYHNSVICQQGISCSYYAMNYEGSTGFVFINNIFSIEGYNATTGWGSMAAKSNLFTFNHNWVGGTYYGAGSLPDKVSLWATDASNLQHVDPPETFWNHSIDPPDFTDIAGTDVINAGIDVGLVYDAAGNVYDDPPSIGAYEIPPVSPTLVTSIDVWGTGGATTITVEDGTLQMLKKTLPVNATDTTCVWSVTDGTGHGSINLTGLLTAMVDGTVTVRATANDDSGIYGEDIITFSNQTPDPGVGLATIITSTIIVPGAIVASSTDNQITDDGGGTISDKGLCWSTSENPTTEDDHLSCGTGTASFDCLMSGLIANTDYHVRAYVINQEGTAYGADVEFTTTNSKLIIKGNKIILNTNEEIMIK